MPYQISDKEFEAVSALTPESRLEHFIKRVADWEEVWSLKNSGGWVLKGTSDGKEVAPFWPHPQYAKACAIEGWVDCVPVEIELAAFLQRWIPGLSKDGRLVSVFATPYSSGVVVEAEILKKAIEEEIEANYGGSV